MTVANALDHAVEAENIEETGTADMQLLLQTKEDVPMQTTVSVLLRADDTEGVLRQHLHLQFVHHDAHRQITPSESEAEGDRIHLKTRRCTMRITVTITTTAVRHRGSRAAIHTRSLANTRHLLCSSRGKGN